MKSTNCDQMCLHGRTSPKTHKERCSGIALNEKRFWVLSIKEGKQYTRKRLGGGRASKSEGEMAHKLKREFLLLTGKGNKEFRRSGKKTRWGGKRVGPKKKSTSEYEKKSRISYLEGGERRGN